MFLITGITGHVGGAAATELLARGVRVRALVRDLQKAAAWKEKGVELVHGEWSDSGALKKALENAEGAYLMMPPVPAPARDYSEAKAVVASYVDALLGASLKRLVVLSSVGSEKTSGLGLITSTHLLEEGLSNLPFSTAFVRAGSFFENYGFGLQVGQGGTLPSFYGPTDRAVPMIATVDIGREVASLLTTEWTGKRIIELGSLVTPNQIASQLGEVLGREVKAVAVPRESWSAALEEMGLPKGKTWAYEEMLDGVNSGWIDFGAEGTERVEGTTTAKEVFLQAKTA